MANNAKVIGGFLLNSEYMPKASSRLSNLLHWGEDVDECNLVKKL
jgi:hypothetical protein